jgi:hypothetical protein
MTSNLVRYDQKKYARDVKKKSAPAKLKRYAKRADEAA